VYLWISVGLAALAVLVGGGITVRELVFAEGRSTKPRLRMGARGRVIVLVVFLVLIIVAQFVLSLSTSHQVQRDCANGHIAATGVTAAVTPSTL
jgi:hypothetical protein